MPAGGARGPWDERMMHGGAPAALIAREVEAAAAGEDMVVARLTVEFLAAVPLGPVSVEASVAKPGKRFQIVEASLDADGRRACLARAVRLRRGEVPDAAAGPGGVAALPAPEECDELEPLFEIPWPSFQPDAVEIRHARGEMGSGAVAAWFRMRDELVPGEAPSGLARAAAAADFTNGLSWILPHDRWLFVNTEVTIHLHSEPEGEWIGLDARSDISAAGIGLARGTLHDRRGPIGACAQALFVGPR